MGENRNGVTGGPELSAVDSPDNTRTDDEDLHVRRRNSAEPLKFASTFQRSRAPRTGCACAAISPVGLPMPVAAGRRRHSGRGSSIISIAGRVDCRAARPD